MQQRKGTPFQKAKMNLVNENLNNLAKFIDHMTNEANQHFQVSQSNRQRMLRLTGMLQILNNKTLPKLLDTVEPDLQKSVKQFQELSKALSIKIENQADFEPELDSLEPPEPEMKKIDQHYSIGESPIKEKKGGIYNIKLAKKNSLSTSIVVSKGVTRPEDNLNLSGPINLEQCNFLFDSCIDEIEKFNEIGSGFHTQKDSLFGCSSIFLSDAINKFNIGSAKTKDTETKENELDMDLCIVPLDFMDESQHVTDKNPYM